MLCIFPQSLCGILSLSPSTVRRMAHDIRPMLIAFGRLDSTRDDTDEKIPKAHDVGNEVTLN